MAIQTLQFMAHGIAQLSSMGDQWLSDSSVVYIEIDGFTFIDNEPIMWRFHGMKPRDNNCNLFVLINYE